MEIEVTIAMSNPFFDVALSIRIFHRALFEKLSFVKKTPRLLNSLITAVEEGDAFAKFAHTCLLLLLLLFFFFSFFTLGGHLKATNQFSFTHDVTCRYN